MSVPPGFFKAENEEEHELVFEYKLRPYSEIKNLGNVTIGAFPNDGRHVRRSRDELDKVIWEATRTMVRRYHDKHRPHEYTTEWETE